MYIWIFIWEGKNRDAADLYFFDVGQGDSELVNVSGIKILTDAGPLDDALIRNLEKFFPGDHYIDLAIISHPQLDHFGGFVELVKNYDIGAFVINGRNNEDVNEWKDLLEYIQRRNIPLITLAIGDRVIYKNSSIVFLSPDRAIIQSGELNETGFVERVELQNLRAIFTADISKNMEHYLISKNSDMRADILKVGHHGSKYSSSDAFLQVINPKITVIEVGKNNRYGHPNKETLARITSSTRAKVFRTDINGTIIIKKDGSTFHITTER